MSRLLLQVGVAAAFGGLLSPGSTSAQSSTPYLPGNIPPPAKRSEHIQIVQGPALEFARDDFAIVRWTALNPGGTDDHFAVIHYGTDPTQLSEMAKSPIRLNREHPQTIFRVRVSDLKPQTTYYYTVISMGSDGISDGETSAVEQFTTPGPGERRLLSDERDKERLR